MVKIVCHAERGLYVVNTPGSHRQRQPRVYRTLDAAIIRARELMVTQLDVRFVNDVP